VLALFSLLQTQVLQTGMCAVCYIMLRQQNNCMLHYSISGVETTGICGRNMLKKQIASFGIISKASPMSPIDVYVGMLKCSFN
jgi:hypothetical protein